MSFRICTIGCGRLASSVHGPSWRKYAETHRGVELAACCDIDVAKASEFMKTFGFSRHYTDYAEMLDRERPDAVCLISPVHLTAGLSSSILGLGYPLMMEKPPGRTKAEALQIAGAAGSSGAPNQVAFNRRYAPLVRELKSMIERDFRCVDMQYIRYDFFRSGRTDSDFSTTAIHAIDAVRFIAESDYSTISFLYHPYPALGEPVADISMQCVMKSGAAAQLNFCPVAGVDVERVTINFLDHTFMLELPIWSGMDSPGRLIHTAGNEVIETLTGKEISDGSEMFEESGFYAENASFFDDIMAGRRPKGDILSAIQSVEVADSIRNRKDFFSDEL